MNEPRYVVDASALLAYMQEERGADRVEQCLQQACISAVNLSEIIAKMIERGGSPAVVDNVIASLELDVRPFDEGQAIVAGHLRRASSKSGLSLGDRACLALAKALDAIALTADRAWAELDLGVEVELIR